MKLLGIDSENYIRDVKRGKIPPIETFEAMHRIDQETVIHKMGEIIYSALVDQEWRIFQEWYIACPEEPFEVCFNSTIKRAQQSQGKVKYDLSKINIVDIRDEDQKEKMKWPNVKYG